MSDVPARAWCHVDMDGLAAIYAHHASRYSGGRDDFYASAVNNSIEFFAAKGLRATYFVIAQDLDAPDKLDAVRRVVSAGHHVASHGLTHVPISTLPRERKRTEIAESRRKIQDALGVPCLGFRAPSYAIDREGLEMIAEAGYAYDASAHATRESGLRLGLPNFRADPFEVFAGRGLWEIPVPRIAGLPPFHPCYSAYLSASYFRMCHGIFSRRARHFTLLCHLTDFATPARRGDGVRLAFYANDFTPLARKMAFLSKLLSVVGRGRTFTTTEEFLDPTLR